MKRICMLLLAILLLIGCQPTPTQEYVVNKKDNAVEQKLTDAADLTPQLLPERWDEVYEGELMTLTFSAPMEQKADGLYPLYKTRQNKLTDDEIVEMLTILFPDPSLNGPRCPQRRTSRRRWNGI